MNYDTGNKVEPNVILQVYKENFNEEYVHSFKQRNKLNNLIYILSSMGLNFGYRYVWLSTGVYCHELISDIGEAFKQ